jgi:hypothetical protein
MSSSTVTLPRWALAGIAAMLAASATANVVTGIPVKPRVFDMCKLPGADCPDLCVGEGCPDVAELILCCEYGTGGCSIAEVMSDCHPELEYVVICTWGRSLESGGVECYD